MGQFQFFLEGIKHFKEVGTVTRSGVAMSKKAASFIPSNQEVIVVELGAGDGVMTKHILHRISKNSTLIAIELNEKLYKQLADIQDDRLIAIHASAEELEAILKQRNIKEVDYMVSAIPFIVFPKEQAQAMLRTFKRLMKSGGLYMQIHYAKRLTSLYESVFGNLQTNFILANLPPAYVFVCEKKEA